LTCIAPGATKVVPRVNVFIGYCQPTHPPLPLSVGFALQHKAMGIRDLFPFLRLSASLAARPPLPLTPARRATAQRALYETRLTDPHRVTTVITS